MSTARGLGRDSGWGLANTRLGARSLLLQGGGSALGSGGGQGGISAHASGQVGMGMGSRAERGRSVVESDEQF